MLDWLSEHSIKICRQSIECSCCFYYQTAHFNWDLVPSEVVYRKQLLSIDAGYIVVVLVWDYGDIQTLLSRILEFIYQHNLICNSNQLSIWYNYSPNNRSMLHSIFWDSWEDDPHHLYWNILFWNCEHTDKFFLFLFGVPIV